MADAPRRPPPPCPHRVVQWDTDDINRCLRCGAVLRPEDFDVYTREVLRRDLFGPLRH